MRIERAGRREDKKDGKACKKRRRAGSMEDGVDVERKGVVAPLARAGSRRRNERFKRRRAALAGQVL